MSVVFHVSEFVAITVCGMPNNFSVSNWALGAVRSLQKDVCGIKSSLAELGELRKTLAEVNYLKSEVQTLRSRLSAPNTCAPTIVLHLDELLLGESALVEQSLSQVVVEHLAEPAVSAPCSLRVGAPAFVPSGQQAGTDWLKLPGFAPSCGHAVDELRIDGFQPYDAVYVRPDARVHEGSPHLSVRVQSDPDVFSPPPSLILPEFVPCLPYNSSHVSEEVGPVLDRLGALVDDLLSEFSLAWAIGDEASPPSVAAAPPAIAPDGIPGYLIDELIDDLPVSASDEYNDKMEIVDVRDLRISLADAPCVSFPSSSSSIRVAAQVDVTKAAQVTSRIRPDPVKKAEKEGQAADSTKAKKAKKAKAKKGKVAKAQKQEAAVLQQ